MAAKRKPVVAGNWKMYKLSGEARDLARAVVAQAVPMSETVEVVLCPPFTALAAVAEVLNAGPIGLGAQTMHWEQKGAFTGEVAPAMLSDIGCDYVILGHSERRALFHETSEAVSRKTLAALEAGLTPIVCVGETLEEREAGRTEAVIAEQLAGSLAGVDAGQLPRVIVAYEPVWAIGTGRTASPDQAQEVHAFIRRQLSDVVESAAAEATRILYGGSVKPDNAADLFAQADIDGGLIGGAALEAGSFLAIIKAAG